MSRLKLHKGVVSTTLIAALLVGVAPRAAVTSGIGTVTGTFVNTSMPQALIGTATGTFVNTNFHQTLIGHEGGDEIDYVTFTNPYSGTLTGSAVETLVQRVHKDGSVTVQLATETCARCTLAGRAGGYSAVWYYIGGSTSGKGSFIFTEGFGGLKGLVGGGRFDQLTASSGSYSYTYYLPK
jgi:hypothetical protein